MRGNEYILKNGRVVDPANKCDEIRDIAFADGVICDPAEVSDQAQAIDLAGRVVAPGLIDLHVHLRQPGNTAAETIASGTAAAASGGFTTIVAMPNTSPAADSPGTIEYIKRHCENNAMVKVLPCGAMSKDLKGEEMSGIGSLKSAGIVALSDDGCCIQNHQLMRHIAEYAASFKLPILDHCEENMLKGAGVMHEGKWSVLLGVEGISSASEELMIARDLLLAEMTKCHFHIQHVSSAGSVEKIREAKRRKLSVSAEVTPHHLALTDEEIKHFDTNYKMNPPLRSAADRLALIEGLKDSTIGIIATDHAPHTETAKMVEFDYAPFGIIGLETALSVCLTELYHAGHLSLSELIAKMTVNPAKVINSAGGTLSCGRAADICIFDPDLEYIIDKHSFKSKSRNTPFDGIKVKGRNLATVVNGKFVFNSL